MINLDLVRLVWVIQDCIAYTLVMHLNAPLLLLIDPLLNRIVVERLCFGFGDVARLQRK